MSGTSFDNIIYHNNRNYTSNGVFISSNCNPMIQSHSYGRNNSSSFKHSFYDVLANYSYFKDNKLVLNHQYVHTRVMNHACWDDIAGNVISNMNNDIDENTAIREYLQQVKLNALLKYCTTRDLFVGESKNTSGKPYKLSSEPEKWIAAMIARHGCLMVAYIDECVAKLTASYLDELKTRQDWSQVNFLCSYTDSQFNTLTLRTMLQVMAALPASYKSTAYSKLALPEPEQATESAPAPAPAKRQKVVEYDQPHSSQFLGLTAEDSSGSMVGEIKTVDWLLDTIAHCTDTRHTPSPQQELAQNNSRFYATTKPFLQPEGSTSAHDPLDLLGQTALLLTPKTVSIPNIESSDSVVDAVCNGTSTESMASTQTSIVDLLASSQAAADVHQFYSWLP
ncbi:hypothetical protein GGF40_002679 [Coemansia sp. RSA 1286]|nr:hypothetical protein GGF40_002679 [Coemansia sp. RSA 1286]